jgi:hypothetical protein
MTVAILIARGRGKRHLGWPSTWRGGDAERDGPAAAAAGEPDRWGGGRDREVGPRGAGGAAEEGAGRAGSERHGGGWSGACQRSRKRDGSGRQGEKRSGGLRAARILGAFSPRAGGPARATRSTIRPAPPVLALVCVKCEREPSGMLQLTDEMDINMFARC